MQHFHQLTPESIDIDGQIKNFYLRLNHPYKTSPPYNTTQHPHGAPYPIMSQLSSASSYRWDKEETEDLISWMEFND